MTTGVGRTGVSAGVGVKVGVGGSMVGVGEGVLQAARSKSARREKIIVDFIGIQEVGLGKRDYYTSSPTENILFSFCLTPDN